MSESAVADLFPDTPWRTGSPRQLVETHEELRLIYPDTPPEAPNGYVFRGELDYRRPLESTLERAVRKKCGLTRSDDLRAAQIRKVEKERLDVFRIEGGGRITESLRQMRKEWWQTVLDVAKEARVAIPNEVGRHPRVAEEHNDKDAFWWLAVMQHYGHPTRLLDFSTDFTIALFMAVQQFLRKRALSELRSTDLLIYCFPCRNNEMDPNDQNKTPIRKVPEKAINLNVALGVEIGLLTEYPEDCSSERKQSWGWDRPYFATPRLWFQKGMFVYPFSALPEDEPLRGGEESWLVKNLRSPARFCVREEDPFRPKRIRIPHNRVDAIVRYLKSETALSVATTYVDYEKVGLEAD